MSASLSSELRAKYHVSKIMLEISLSIHLLIHCILLAIICQLCMGHLLHLMLEPELDGFYSGTGPGHPCQEG